jgi:hypothetical protein
MHTDTVDQLGRLRTILMLARHAARRVNAICSLRASDVLLSRERIVSALAAGGKDVGGAAHMPHGGASAGGRNQTSRKRCTSRQSPPTCVSRWSATWRSTRALATCRSSLRSRMPTELSAGTQRRSGWFALSASLAFQSSPVVSSTRTGVFGPQSAAPRGCVGCSGRRMEVDQDAQAVSGRRRCERPSRGLDRKAEARPRK